MKVEQRFVRRIDDLKLEHQKQLDEISLQIMPDMAPENTQAAAKKKKIRVPDAVKVLLALLN